MSGATSDYGVDSVTIPAQLDRSGARPGCIGGVFMATVFAEAAGEVFEYWTEHDPIFEISSGVGRCILPCTRGLVIVRGPLPNFLAGFGAATGVVEAALRKCADVVQLRQPEPFFIQQFRE